MSAQLRIELGASGARGAPGEPCAMACLVEAGRDGRLGEREEASLARHIATCAPCRALANDLDEVRTLLRRSTGGPISSLAHQRGRLMLLRAASEPPPPSTLEAVGPGRTGRRRGAALGAVAFLVLGAVAFAALAVPWRRPAPAPVAAITTGPQAPPDASPAEPAPITTGLQAAPDPVPTEPAVITTRVEPQVARVAARTRAVPAKSLPMGEPSRPPPQASRTRVAAPVAAPPEPPATDEGVASRSFARAVDLIARGDYAAAGSELQAFRVAHPGDGRADLAAFLTIVSLQRAGRRGEARDAARHYLELYPAGDRRADVLRVANER